MRETLIDLSKFLEKPLSEENLNKLIQHLQFDSMKVNPAVNYSLRPPPHADEKYVERSKRTGYNFIRRGQTGSYTDEMPKEYIQKFDAQTKIRFGSYSDLY